MKKLTCSAIGGVCEHEIIGKSAEDVAQKGYEHIKSMSDEAHQNLKKKIDDSSEENKQKWMEGFNKTFEEAPDA